jgi:aryl-alcohol dehydrogenase-like predicted oxidoreductase
MRRFVPRRPLGRTGFVATSLGIGDVADRNLPIDACVATVRRAIAAGLNLIDTAPGYEDGYSEEIVGRAVADCRESMFVIDKIDHLDQPVAPQIEASLSRLGLPSVDAFVFHNLSSMQTFEHLMENGFDELAAAIGKGQSRFRGVSSHNPDVLVTAMKAGVCDIVMFPLGPFVDARYVTEVLPLARQLEIGTVCFKTFGAGKLVADTTGYNQPLQRRPRGKSSSGGSSNAVGTLPRLSVRDCVHYTMTLDPDVALLGLSFPNEQDDAFEAAAAFAPLPDSEMQRIAREAVAAREGKGPCWWNPSPEV